MIINSEFTVELMHIIYFVVRVRREASSGNKGSTRDIAARDTRNTQNEAYLPLRTPFSANQRVPFYAVDDAYDGNTFSLLTFKCYLLSSDSQRTVFVSSSFFP